jgi:hypothetical protein
MAVKFLEASFRQKAEIPPDAVQAAACSVVAGMILNLDETITHE